MTMRTLQWDPDYRRKPKTDTFCAYCQRDLKPGQRRRWVHIVLGGGSILHPSDPRWGDNIEEDAGDLLCHPVGVDCARKIGLEWTKETL